MAVGRVSFGYLARRAKHQLHTDGRWHSRRVQHPQGHHRRDLQGRRQLPPPVTKKDIPRLSSRRTESGDDCIYAVVMQSRSSTTPHLPSYFLLITSIQLFHHQFYGHTFPVPNEPSKSEVHQIPSHPALICSIELPHSFNLSCPVCCDIIATTIHTDFSSYTVPSIPEVF